MLGFHGCALETAEAVFQGKTSLLSSTNAHDWLGHGIYFWEGDPGRAQQWANRRHKQRPAVVGVILDLGNCPNLVQGEHRDLLKPAFESLRDKVKSAGTSLPANTLGKDKVKRELDCAVIQHPLQQLESSGEVSLFDSVRGSFDEGNDLYPGAGIRESSHIQICVRNPACILGYFRPMDGLNAASETWQAQRLQELTPKTAR